MSYSEIQILKAILTAATMWGTNARIGYERMAALSGYTTRWCMELVRRLEEKNLLRVKREWLGPATHAINIYQVVRPWLRELSLRQLWERKQARTEQERSTAQMGGGERSVHLFPNTKEREEKPDTPEAIRQRADQWCTPGSQAWEAHQYIDPG